jgi:hypothetical protein
VAPGWPKNTAHREEKAVHGQCHGDPYHGGVGSGGARDACTPCARTVEAQQRDPGPDGRGGDASIAGCATNCAEGEHCVPDRAVLPMTTHQVRECKQTVRQSGG